MKARKAMTTITTPRITATTWLPTCPWWCTAGPETHAWQLDRDGAWTRTHRRQVGGFTMSATERVTNDGESRLELHPTQADFVLVDDASRASELSEDLHQVAAILRQIESGQGQ
jgi:hypothetical protein